MLIHSQLKKEWAEVTVKDLSQNVFAPEPLIQVCTLTFPAVWDNGRDFSWLREAAAFICQHVAWLWASLLLNQQCETANTVFVHIYGHSSAAFSLLFCLQFKQHSLSANMLFFFSLYLDFITKRLALFEKRPEAPRIKTSSHIRVQTTRQLWLL